jgi:predicted enzyme related to lactoylglutathione lyase
MITGLNGVSVWGDDHKRLLPFYRDTLKLPLMFESDGFAVFGQPGGSTVLVGTHSEVHGPNADPARHIVTLGSDDIESDFGRLRDAGVTVIAAPSMQGPEMMIATLADPDGNLFSLMQSVGAGPEEQAPG